MRSLSLTRNSPAPRDRDLAAVRGERGDGRQLVDQRRDFVRRDLDRAGAIAFDHDRAARLAGLRDRGRRSTVDPRAEAPQHVEQAVRVGLSPTSSISTREPGSAAAATSQNAADEKSPGTVSVRARSRWPPATDTVSPSTATRPPNAGSARSVWSRVARRLASRS